MTPSPSVQHSRLLPVLPWISHSIWAQTAAAITALIRLGLTLLSQQLSPSPPLSAFWASASQAWPDMAGGDENRQWRNPAHYSTQPGPLFGVAFFVALLIPLASERKKKTETSCSE